jgi:hypothetical protein
MLGLLSPIYVIAFLSFAAFGFSDDSPVSSNSGGGSGTNALEGVKGRVTAPDGSPIVNALVQPKSLDDPSTPIPEIAILTDEDGRYKWRLFPGEYEISVSAEGYQPAIKRATVKAGQAAMLDFKLERIP